MVKDKDDIIDKFKDIDHSKEIEELQKSKEPKTIKASDNKDYDNFGFHWYPKQNSTSYGALFGLAIMGLGILILLTQIIFRDIGSIVIALVMIIGGWLIAGRFSEMLSEEKSKLKKP